MGKIVVLATQSKFLVNSEAQEKKSGSYGDSYYHILVVNGG
jgi:hypothetical protein